MLRKKLFQRIEELIRKRVIEAAIHVGIRNHYHRHPGGSCCFGS